jgi:serine/threonine-protein kinase
MASAAGNGDGLAPGTVLGRYEIGRQLGRGGMGAVYEAVHRDLRKQVAVKVLSAALAHDEVARQRFLREGEAVSRIRHPHVVDVTDVGAEGEHLYLVMELLQGEDLASRIQRGPLAPTEAVDLLLPVLAGVHAAHQEGIIHRDLKPENIFLARQRIGGLVPKVLDFGVSKLATEGKAMALTGTAAVFGTPYYMPPEQIRGARQADHRSDQYALGVVLYEALTGRRPYEGENIYAILHAIGSGEFVPPRALRAEIPPALEAAILRAMSLDPAQRFPSVAALGTALLPLAGETARVLWSDTFRASANAAATTAVMDAPPPPPAAGPPGSISGTRLLEGRGGGTTLGAGTGQVLTAPVPARAGRWAGIAGALAVLAAAAWFGVPRLRRPEPPPLPAPPTTAVPAPPARAAFSVDVSTDPPAAEVELDGEPAGTGRLQRSLPRDGREHRLLVHAPGYRDREILFIDNPPPARLTLTREAATPIGHVPEHDTHHHRPAPPAARPAEPPAAPPPEPAVPRTANGAPVLE